MSMRAILGTHWVVACALALGACAMDDAPADNTPKDKTAKMADLTASASTSAEASPVTIPEELSFENLPVVTPAGDEGEDHHHHCHVEVFCHGGHHHDFYGGRDDDDDDHDHHHHHHPSYCTYGDCWHEEEEHKARERCYHECDHADCDDVWDEGRCDHDDHGDHGDLRPDTSQI